jgi:hypothetical protein
MDRKLSTMMMLGAGLVEQNPDTYLRKDEGQWCGCAIGMACLAAGESSAANRHIIFPWLNSSPSDNYSSFESIISQKFREAYRQAHVDNKSAASLEGLADWIRSVEPACGECNSFKCVCIPVAVEETVAAAV